MSRQPRPDARRVVGLPRLTSLRAVAALGVFCYHLGYNLHLHVAAQVFRDGFTGVGFFFALSGFVLTWSARPGEGVRRFYWRRFARIYPNHVAATILTVLLVSGAGWTAIAANLALVQSWFALSFSTLHLVTGGVNPPSWSLACEAFFYALFPLTLVFHRRSPIAFTVAGALWWAGWLVVVLVATHGHPTNWVIVNAYLNPLVRSGEFLGGCVAAALMSRGWRPPWNLAHAFAFLCASEIASRVLHLSLPTPDAALSPAFVAVILAAAAADVRNPRGLLTAKPLVYAGGASYAFYLVQYPILRNVHHVSNNEWVMSLAAFMGTAIVAVAFHHLVEIPAMKRLTRRGMTEPTASSLSET